jgi:hypothetical protein
VQNSAQNLAFQHGFYGSESSGPSAQFWMIYGIGQKEPTMRHSSYEDAEHEAKRLARNNPGTEFYILISVAKAKKVDVEIQKFGVWDEDNRCGH